MVFWRKKKDYYDIDDLFDLIEAQIRRSLEMTKRMFDRFSGIGGEMFEGFAEPLADIIDEGDKYVIEVDLPGFRKEDITINAYNHTLEIIAKRRAEVRKEQEGVIRMERVYSGFRRIFTLPEDADMDKIKAKYENGVLRIEVGKREGVHRRRINIE